MDYLNIEYCGNIKNNYMLKNNEEVYLNRSTSCKISCIIKLWYKRWIIIIIIKIFYIILYNV